MEPSRLLLLPKELRLSIWEYVLTGSSRERRILSIRRKYLGRSSANTRFSNSLHGGTASLEVEAIFDEQSLVSINVNLLKTSKLLYEEALPVLYHFTTFHICDLEGVFPLFMNTLSPFAQSHIRYVRLSIYKTSHDYGTPMQDNGASFYWAVTCAQVARQVTSLRLLEIEGNWPISGNTQRKRSILHPLVKFKAPKKFVPSNDAKFQQLLAEAAREMKSRALARRVSKAPKVVEETRGAETVKERNDRPRDKKQRRLDSMTEKTSAAIIMSQVTTENKARDLRIIPGIDQFEKELSEWDLVDLDSRSSQTKKLNVSILDNESWTGVASTIVAKDEDADEWELVNYSPGVSDQSGKS